MFNQKEYIKEYNKNNYYEFKIRIRKDDKLLMDKINSLDNINKYVINLIQEDVKKNIHFHYINNDIKIDFPVCHTIQDLIIKAEKADLEDDYGTYMNLAAAIDARAKHEVTFNKMRESQWNKLIMRYCL